MTIELSVSEVRAALLQAAQPEDRGAGEPASRLLGRIFHEIFADLVSSTAHLNGLQLIAESGPDRQRRVDLLQEHLWRKLTAPRLLRHAALLQSSSQQVVVLWRALSNLSHWLIDIVVELLEHSPLARAEAHQLERYIHAEVPLTCLLHEPGWTEPVELTGIADSLLYVPERPHVCALELKLGQNVPAVDLGQAALYHLILQRSQNSNLPSSLALLRFSPDLEELLIPHEKTKQLEGELLQLIGRLAQVLPVHQKTQPGFPAVPRPSASTTGPRSEPSPQSTQLSAPSDSASVQASFPLSQSNHYEALGTRLLRAYREYGIAIEIREPVQVGPRFLRFEVKLQKGSRIDKLRLVSNEIQALLELPFAPLIGQTAGRVTVDIARPDPTTVLFSSVRSQLPTADPLYGSAKIPVGVDPGGRLHLVDLSTDGRSHLLAAGTSGSGKSEWLRMMLAGLLTTNTPETLRIITLDPKVVAFQDLEKSRFLWKENSWWIPGPEQRPASHLLHELMEEMERRYQLIREAQVDKLQEYIQKTGRPLPRIVCVCDEYFSLIAHDRNEKKEIEWAISLLGAKARAAGVHLVLATQQPSRATISGAIQTNLPCRVALTLTSAIESNMILGSPGAERLTLRGDLLYKDFGEPIRLQAPYLPEAERVAIFRS